MRILVILLLLLNLGCSEPAMPSSPPGSEPILDRLPSDPLSWRFDGPLEAKHIPNCQPGSVLAEKLAFNRTEFTVVLEVRIDEKGKKVEITSVTPPDNALGREIAEQTKSCVEMTEFRTPRRLPWHAKLTVHVPATRGAT